MAMAPFVFFLLAAACFSIPLRADEAVPPVTVEQMRQVHDRADFDRLCRIARVLPRDRSADAVNRYRRDRLTPEFAEDLERLIAATAPAPGPSAWVRDFRDLALLIYGPGYTWTTLQEKVADLRERYDKLDNTDAQSKAKQ